MKKPIITSPRPIIGLLIGLLLSGTFVSSATANEGHAEHTQPTDAEITVYKSPTCGCCKTWIDHLRAEGFTVKGIDRHDMPQIKANFGVDRPLQSCHTAVVDGYVIEGHVPASDIKRLLSERPDVLGLTAPGMPKKSPGMQPDHLPPKDYDVLSFDHRGKVELFRRY